MSCVRCVPIFLNKPGGGFYFGILLIFTFEK